MNVDCRSDKHEECLRYDRRALAKLQAADELSAHLWGAASIPLIYRAPYLFYEQRIRELVLPHHHVLELGSGIGLHTHALLRTGAVVTATDISPNSLVLLTKCLADIGRGGRLKTLVADMESLPFEEASFDVVSIAGSLSYGAPGLVDAEVRRVLKSGGSFICVDSLHHNPIYRLNRWVHWLLGSRTKATLRRMPTLSRIDSIGSAYQTTEVKFFGALSWVMPLLEKVVSQERAANYSDRFDQVIQTRLSAFKFVLVANGRK